jgi:predicted deacylase
VVARRTLVFDHPLLAGLEHPAFEVVGPSDGPHLSLIGGIHGCEYSSIAAVTRFMNEVGTAELAGSILAVPVVSMEAFRRRSPFVVPVDGKNLNRSFPGSSDGGYTDALARAIFDQLIAPADVVLDLHGGDMVEALEPFTLYTASAVEEKAEALAVAFGLPYVVRDVPSGGLGGTTTSAAAEAGIPAIIAEAGGRGQLEEGAVQLLLDGLSNVLRRLEMLPGEPSPPSRPIQRIASFVWLRCRDEGWWEPAVGVGEEVTQGRLLGVVRNLWGDVLEEIHASERGVVLFVTTSPAVGEGGLLLGLGTDLSPLTVST